MLSRLSNLSALSSVTGPMRPPATKEPQSSDFLWEPRPSSAGFQMVGLIQLSDVRGFWSNKIRKRWVEFIEKSFRK